MIRIALIGAGSTVFAKRLVGDILLTPELGSGVEIMLHDIDTERLKTSEIVTRRLAESLGLEISIQALRGRWMTSWQLISAGSVIAALPPVLMFFMLQKHFITGLTLGAVKE